jgi:UDP-N-acetylglucosamine transferase subunit ALG13
MTALLVSTIGGHLSALHELVPRFGGVDLSERLWVTHDSPQSRSLLAGEDVVYVPYIEERDLRGVLCAFGPARRLIVDRRIDTAISTGSAIAVAYLGAARSLGRAAHFIESTAFVTENSITGRILRRVPGVHTYAQSPLLERHGFAYRGSALDGFTAERVRPPRPPRRIVVTVGTSEEFGFRRLLDRLTTIIPPASEVLWQTGCTDVSGLPLDATPWMPADRLVEAMRAADVVVAHAGGGSAIAALGAGRRPILVPRVAAFGDFRNDHQQQIAAMLAERGLAAVHSVDQLDTRCLAEATGWLVRPADALPRFELDVA